MRPALLTGIMFFAFLYTATAQKFSLLPQVGLENSRTTLKYNNLSSFSPLGAEIAPRLGLRLQYKITKMHGAFAGVATNRSVVALQSTDPGSGIQSFKSSAGNLRPQVEAGYQFSTKPIYFNKSRSASKAPQSFTGKSSKSNITSTYTSKRCGASSAKSSCGKSSSTRMSKATPAPKNNGMFVSIKPSIGAAFVPGVMDDVTTKTQGNQTNYIYNAGNFTTALITGAAFEFGSQQQKKFTVSIQYLKGLGNLGKRSIATASEGKTMVTNFSSNVSSWNLTAGIPISLGKKQKVHVQKQAPKRHNYENKCGQYRMNYRRVI